MATASWGFDGSGRIVPTDGQMMAQYAEGRQAIREVGTPEFLVALAALHDWAQSQVRAHYAGMLSPRWGSLLKAPDPSHRTRRLRWEQERRSVRFAHRIPWVLEGSISEKAAVIDEAHRVCRASGGQAVLVMLRLPYEKPCRISASRDPWEPEPSKQFDIAYRLLLVVPRPVRIHAKRDGRRFLDWKPVAVEPPREREKLYHVGATEVFTNQPGSPDDYRIDAEREAQMLAVAIGDLARQLTRKLHHWRAEFRIE